jgi:hypothetical protein
MVVPFQGVSGGEGGQLLAGGLTNGLIADLVRFDALQVFAAAPGDGGAPLPAPAAVGARLTSTQTKPAHLAGLPRGSVGLIPCVPSPGYHPTQGSTVLREGSFVSHGPARGFPAGSTSLGVGRCRMQPGAAISPSRAPRSRSSSGSASCCC